MTDPTPEAPSPALPRPPEFPRRLVYFGTPEAAVAPLRALVDAGFDVPLVVSRPDRRRGRRAEPTPSPVKAAALELGIPVSVDVADALAVDADCGVVVAYGRLISEATLRALPMINVHFSMLPRWRGAAPVERALLAGDDVTGVAIMGLDVTLDTGAVYAEETIPIAPADTAAELRERLVDVGAALLVETLRRGLRDPRPQVGEPTYAAKIERSDLLLDFTSTPEQCRRVISLGGAWTHFRDRVLKIHDVEPVEPPDLDDSDPSPVPGQIVTDRHAVVVRVGDGWLRLVTVQPEGKQRVDASAWANGARLAVDDRLGE